MNDEDDSSIIFWAQIVFFSIDGSQAYRSETADYSMFPLGSPEKSKIIRMCFALDDVYNLEDIYLTQINALRQANLELVESIIDNLHGEIVNAVTPEELTAVKNKLFTAIRTRLPELNDTYNFALNYFNYNARCMFPGVINILNRYNISSFANWGYLQYPIQINQYFASGGVIEAALELNPGLKSVLGPYDYASEGLNKTLQVNTPITYNDIICLCSFTDPVTHLSIWDIEANAPLTENDSFGGMQYSRGYDITMFYNCKENYFILTFTNSLSNG